MYKNEFLFLLLFIWCISAEWMGFPGGRMVKNPPANAGDTRFDPWVRKIPWSRKWQPTPLTAVCQVSLSFTISWRLLKLMSIELVMSSHHLILFHTVLLLPSIVSNIMVFSKLSWLNWPMSWLFTSGGQNIGVQHQSFQWIFRIDLLVVQGTLKSLLQHFASEKWKVQ